MEVRLDLVGIVTRDMRASLAFYRRLGLEAPAEAQDEIHAEGRPPAAFVSPGTPRNSSGRSTPTTQPRPVATG